MPGPAAKAPDAGEGRASEPVAAARTGRRLLTPLHYGGNRMREACERIPQTAANAAPARCVDAIQVAQMRGGRVL